METWRVLGLSLLTHHSFENIFFKAYYTYFRIGLRIVPIQVTFINLKIKNVVFKAGSKTIVISKPKVVAKDTHPPKKEKDSNEEDTSTRGSKTRPE
jgi:hypothetical protein